MNSFEWQENGPGEAGRADKAVFDHFPRHAGETVLLQTSTNSARDATFRAAVADVQTRLRRTPHVNHVEGPYAASNAGQISRDGRAALVNFRVDGDFEQAEKRVDGPLESVAAAAEAHPQLRIEQFGEASAAKALSKVFENDFKKAEPIQTDVSPDRRVARILGRLNGDRASPRTGTA